MYEDIEEEYFDETYMEENGWDLKLDLLLLI